MILKSLELTDFRNYANVTIPFSEGTNILYGDNAQGKTNILEAIFLSSTTKSHKGSKDREIIRFGCGEAHIRTTLLKDNATYRVDMHLRDKKSKVVAIDSQKIKRAAELMGLLNVVFFSPEDLAIIKAGPSERRRFMDMELCQLDAAYLHHLNQYNRAVQQRNRFLKEMFDTKGSAHWADMLDVFDEQLLEYGSHIIERREAFIEELNGVIASVHRDLTEEKEHLEIRYEPDTDSDEFAQRLGEARERDVFLKMTSVGPHRDDFSFLLRVDTAQTQFIDLRKYGSQGQQRTAALSLKLSEIETVKRVTKELPVLLLDDVLSELDANRQNALLNSIGSLQTIITCTGLDEFVNNRFEINKLFKVNNGSVVAEN
ncbi:MAG: DNA replication/repair protein RecF [Lachnospiraceae bacterium]|nr:DNA replication/repair protein RecF [Lachnospiraceae bacterium]